MVNRLPALSVNPQLAVELQRVQLPRFISKNLLRDFPRVAKILQSLYHNFSFPDCLTDLGYEVPLASSDEGLSPTFSRLGEGEKCALKRALASIMRSEESPEIKYAAAAFFSERLLEITHEVVRPFVEVAFDEDPEMFIEQPELAQRVVAADRDTAIKTLKYLQAKGRAVFAVADVMGIADKLELSLSQKMLLTLKGTEGEEQKKALEQALAVRAELPVDYLKELAFRWLQQVSPGYQPDLCCFVLDHNPESWLLTKVFELARTDTRVYELVALHQRVDFQQRLELHLGWEQLNLTAGAERSTHRRVGEALFTQAVTHDKQIKEDAIKVLAKVSWVGRFFVEERGKTGRIQQGLVRAALDDEVLFDLFCNRGKQRANKGFQADCRRFVASKARLAERLTIALRLLEVGANLDLKTILVEVRGNEELIGRCLKAAGLSFEAKIDFAFSFTFEKLPVDLLSALLSQATTSEQKSLVELELASLAMAAVKPTLLEDDSLPAAFMT
ncbi:hypothetical protein COT42_01355 [Candidatus Saganbacteria bacterium CG08_land_8_20_14_0_20_45_16]|uniref:Uncharacterized protein n=1 Tax=Candidatus Saganbacteria bacterium CG08_land_8_20_14_0_20_45_16 TaxID=2014293 RepID=A0A2H0Y198_UNCSA|nr:MAG: hypothetical protein COT42_01355 [Candidatus Saganbacteria bacterium CG08_land_8_20_14_0_20_45_16]